MKLLRQNTAATIAVGVLVDNANGYSPVTSLVATGGGAVDEISIYKHDATAAVDIKATTTFTHRAGGTYTLTLAAGDVNTLGRLRVVIRDDDQVRPHVEDFLVVPAQVFDSLAGSDLLQVDPRELAGIAAAATNLARGAEALIIGAVDGVATTTSIPSDLANTYDDNHFVGRYLTCVEGPAKGQSAEITGYDGGSSTFTVAALTSAPANGNRFVVS